MNTLVISDHLYNLVPKNVNRNKWNDAKLPSLGGYDVIMVDLTFKKRRNDQNRINLLHALKGKLEKRDFLSKHHLIVVVVCGSPKEDLKIDVPYDAEEGDHTQYEEELFGSYDFLKNIIPGYPERLEFEESQHGYSTATIPVNLYLDRYEGDPNFLYYDYDPDSEKCIDVTPLAKMKQNSNSCIAFECKAGKGLAVILPSYNLKDKQEAMSLLLKICKSYYKKRHGMIEVIKKADTALPPSVREAYIEALLCFNYNLYTAALAMCRRTLEASVIAQGIDNKEKLWKKIEELHKKEIIGKELMDVATEIRLFGNIGAHFDKYRGEQVTEAAVIEVIDFLEIYFDSCFRIQKKVQDSQNRRQGASTRG